jgi:FKBP-type peptidyl-prolyl cis-trans isomerase SlyD
LTDLSPAIFSKESSVRVILLSFVTLLSLLTLCSPPHLGAAEKSKNDRVIKDGMMVSLEYTLKSADGKVMETSKGREPLKYIHGKKMMIPGLEKELTGMKIGGEKHVTVKPEDGYGKINPNAVQEIPKEKIPPNGLKVGAVLAAKSPEGMVVPMTVRQIKEKTVVLDMNHPMAGKTLVFDVKVVDIQPAPLPPSSQPATPAPPTKPATPGQPAKPAEPGQKK